MFCYLVSCLEFKVTLIRCQRNCQIDLLDIFSSWQKGVTLSHALTTKTLMDLWEHNQLYKQTKEDRHGMETKNSTNQL